MFHVIFHFIFLCFESFFLFFSLYVFFLIFPRGGGGCTDFLPLFCFFLIFPWGGGGCNELTHSSQLFPLLMDTSPSFYSLSFSYGFVSFDRLTKSRLCERHSFFALFSFSFRP